MILAFDTETTGLPDFKAPSDAEHQPHIVQLAMILLDDDGSEAACIDLIVKPEGWVISYCTMRAATPIVNLPPTAKMVAAGFNKPKPPPPFRVHPALLRRDPGRRPQCPRGRPGLRPRLPAPHRRQG